MHLSRYVTCHPLPDDPDRVMLFSTVRGSVVVVPVSLLAAIADGSIAPADAAALTRLGFLVPDPEGEKRAMLDALADAGRRNTTFRAMVVLNLDCNLACTYCFEGGLKGRRYLSAETADRLVTFIQEKHLDAGRDVKLTFYGGEPLLSMEMMVGISERLQAAAAARGKTYSFGMVTNGTLLTRGVVERLLPLGLTGAKVTLDGPRETHDRFRPFVSGKGSFDTIVGNMLAVWDLVKLTVGGNYTPDSYRDFPRLLDDLIRVGLTPERIDLLKFDPVAKSGGSQAPPEFNDGCCCVDEPWLQEASIFLREAILARGFHTPRLSPAPCMIESAHDLVVQYDGTLYKCPAFFGWPDLAVGDLETGVRDYAASHNLDVWKQDVCLECSYLPLCFGGCRFLKLVRDGRIDGVDCQKDYYDATLKDFVAQDLRHRPRKARH